MNEITLHNTHLNNKGEVMHNDAYKPFVHRIPEYTYSEWLDTIWSMLQGDDSEEGLVRARSITLGFMKKYILRQFPTYKLMAFEEVRKGQSSVIPYGFYIKLRLMTEEEQKIANAFNHMIRGSAVMVNDVMYQDSPQWTLELDSIPADEIRQLLIT